jgi:hypothetical protein
MGFFMPSKSVNLEAGTVEFDFGDAGKRVINVKEFKPETVAHATLHGFSQVLGDSYASAAKKMAEGESIEACSLRLFESRLKGLNEGWTTRGTGEAVAREPAVDIEVLSQAIAQVRRKDQAKVLAHLQGLRAAKKHGEVSGWARTADIAGPYAKLLAKAGKTVAAKDDSVFD